MRNAISKLLGWKSEPEVPVPEVQAAPPPSPAEPKGKEPPLTLLAPQKGSAGATGNQTPAQALARRLATAAAQAPEQAIRPAAAARHDPLRAAKRSAAEITQDAAKPAKAQARPVVVTAAVTPAAPETAPADHPPPKVNLAALSALDGFIGAALVDSRRNVVLDTARGTPGFDLDTAALSYGDVVRAKLAAVAALKLDDHIEDIVAVLGHQYHMVRPLAARPEIFVYLALNRAQANLALARSGLRTAEQG